MTVRCATEKDIPLLCALRRQQLIDEGIRPDTDIDPELEAWFAGRLADGTLVEWLQEENGKIIATGAVVFYSFPPTYTNPSGMKGYITNMYTDPAWRRRGLATAMLDRAVREARQRGVRKLWLGASTLGRPVYLHYGFRQTGEWLDLDLD